MCARRTYTHTLEKLNKYDMLAALLRRHVYSVTFHLARADANDSSLVRAMVGLTLAGGITG